MQACTCSYTRIVTYHVYMFYSSPVLANLRTGLDLLTGPPRYEKTLRTGLDPQWLASCIGI